MAYGVRLIPRQTPKAPDNFEAMMDIDLEGLDGYVARPYAGTDDHDALARLLNRWNLATSMPEVVTRSDIDNSYANLENCDPETDMVLVDAPDGSLAGYTRIQWGDVATEPTRYWVVPHIDPDHRETPLAMRLTEAGIARSAGIAENREAPRGRVLEGYADRDNEPEIYSMYEKLGFHPATYGASMVMSLEGDLPDATLPDGLAIRPVTEEHLRSIWEAHNEAFRDHWGYVEPTEKDWQWFLGFPHLDLDLWRVAWDGNEIAGQVRSFINDEENRTLGRRRGYTEFISTAREWRKQGVASALICASLRALRDRGMNEAALGVHAENPNGAYELYQKLGFEVENEWVTFHREF